MPHTFELSDSDVSEDEPHIPRNQDEHGATHRWAKARVARRIRVDDERPIEARDHPHVSVAVAAGAIVHELSRTGIAGGF